MTPQIDRRSFIRGAAELAIGFALFGTTSVQAATRNIPSPNKRTLPLPSDEVDSWLTIDTAGNVVVYTGYIDSGTGIETVIRQVAADELDVEFSAVTSVLGDTGLTPYAGISYGSDGVPAAGHQIRIAAATARDVLIKWGAAQLGIPAEQLATDLGRVMARDGRSIGYGTLVQGRRFAVTLPSSKKFNGPILETSAPLKTPAQRRIIGRSVPRVDLAAKVFGTHEFVHNVRIPGMWHGRIVRPPSEQQVTLLGIDETSIRSIASARVFRKGNWIGVIAPREEDAIRAAQMLKVEWKIDGPALPVHADRYDALRRAPQKRLEQEKPRGDAAAAIATAATQFERTYRYPYQLHGMSGPSCAVADVRADGSATVWSGTQAPHEDRDAAAAILGFDPAKVRLIWRQAPGSYGRLGADDAVADAVILSQLAGRPVRVQWMRTEEHGWETLSPAMVIDVRAGLDRDGKVVGLDYHHWTMQHDLARRGHMLAWRHSGQAQDQGWAWGGGVMAGHYAFPNLSITKHIVHEIVRPASLRAPGYAQSYFALESFLDELAAAIDADPIEFRLRHLTDPRAIAVLRTLAQRAARESGSAASRRQRKQSDGTAQGRGAALIQEGNTFVASVAHVTVDPKTGVVQVSKVFSVGDHGEIMNPDGLRNQYEGGLLQGISRALFEEVTFVDSKRTTLDWGTYPVLRYDAVPEFDIYHINNPAAGFLGGGEAPTATVPAAIANAIYDAVGVRLRSVPFTPQSITTALASSS